MINRLIKTFFNKQFFTFVFVGCINTFAGVLFSALYSSFLQPNIAFVIGYFTGSIVSYILNSIFTFNEKLSLKKYFSFFVNIIPNFIIQNLVVYIIFNILEYPKLIAYALAAVVGIPVTYILLKINTFKKRN